MMNVALTENDGDCCSAFFVSVFLLGLQPTQTVIVPSSSISSVIMPAGTIASLSAINPGIDKIKSMQPIFLSVNCTSVTQFCSL